MRNKTKSATSDQTENKVATVNASSNEANNQPQKNTAGKSIVSNQPTESQMLTVVINTVKHLIHVNAGKVNELVQFTGNDTFVTKVTKELEDAIRSNSYNSLLAEYKEMKNLVGKSDDELSDIVKKHATKVAAAELNAINDKLVKCGWLGGTGKVEFTEINKVTISVADNGTFPVVDCNFVISYDKVASTLELAKATVEKFTVEKQHIGYARNIVVANIDYGRYPKDEFGVPFYSFKVKESHVIKSNIKANNLFAMIRTLGKAQLYCAVARIREIENQTILNSYGIESDANFYDFFSPVKNCNFIAITDKNGDLIPSSCFYAPCMKSRKLVNSFDVTKSYAYHLAVDCKVPLDDSRISQALDNWANDRLKELEFISVCGREITSKLNPAQNAN